MEPAAKLCPDERVTAMLGLLGRDTALGREELDTLIEEYADDPRLIFLKGSLLAGDQQYEAARSMMRRAVDLAPEFHVARFQLGFLLLSSGEPVAAQEAWGPLHALPPENYLRIFVNGLCHLIRDEFDAAIRDLEEGISLNPDNQPMNRDMELIIAEIRSKQSTGGKAVSAVDLLLQQSALKTTKH